MKARETNQEQQSDKEEDYESFDDYSTADAEDVENIETARPTNALSAEEKKKHFEKAKQKLSKWSQRLFDPNRPRGLVEPPKIIPLNDHFLTSFGIREKDYDEKTGRDVDIDNNIDISEELEKEKLNEGNKADSEEDELEEKDGQASENRVRLSNLAYTTSQKAIEEECKKYGSIIDVNLIMDMEKLSNSTIPLSVGRAFVTFLDSDSAMKCVEGLNDRLFDGRIVHARLIQTLRKKSTNVSFKSKQSRYWENDISTKCNRCRQVGHIEANCPNEEKPRPCILCGSEEHSFRDCLYSTFCFNCGLPGHVSRSCSLPKGMPRRIVCTNCYSTGHHRLICRYTLHENFQRYANCIVCDKPGAFICCKAVDVLPSQPTGLYCFNCGQTGHLGYDCTRPKVDRCARDTELAHKEIDKAYSCKDSTDISKPKQKRGRGRQSANEPSKRAKSAPSRLVNSQSSYDNRDYESPKNYNTNRKRNNYNQQSTNSSRGYKRIRRY